MPGQNDSETHQRLKERTAELTQEHERLSLDRTPFNQADHDEHTADLQKHAVDLKDHRERLHRGGK